MAMLWRVVVQSAGLCVAVLFTILLIGPAPASAQGISFDVFRGPGTESCPDHDALSGQLAKRMQASKATRAASSDRVGISIVRGHDGGYLATVTALGGERGTRQLVDTDETCAGLAQALTLVLCLIADGQPLAAQQRPEPASNVASNVAPSRPWEIGAGGWLSTHALGAASFGVSADVLWRPWPWVSAALGALWLPGRDVPAGPGSSTVSIVAGTSSLCGGLWFAHARFFPAVCAQLGLGGVHGAGQGYENARSVWRPWWVAGAAAKLDVRVHRRLTIAAQGGRLFALRDEEFTVGRVGPVYQSGDPGWLMGIALLWRIP